jgi:hypothetical protein
MENKDGSGSPQLDDWMILLKHHLNRRPLMQPRDVFKLFYQGILGPEHLFGSATAFAERLYSEYETLVPNLDDPLFESIHPGQTLLRINLRPFKAARLELDPLLDACLRTGRRSWGFAVDLHNLWDSFTDIYGQGQLAAFTPDELTDFTAWLACRDYPAVHHSQVYRQVYLPAYRLVASDLAVQWAGKFNLQD